MQNDKTTLYWCRITTFWNSIISCLDQHDDSSASSSSFSYIFHAKGDDLDLFSNAFPNSCNMRWSMCVYVISDIFMSVSRTLCSSDLRSYSLTNNFMFNVAIATVVDLSLGAPLHSSYLWSNYLLLSNVNERIIIMRGLLHMLCWW